MQASHGVRARTGLIAPLLLGATSAGAATWRGGERVVLVAHYPALGGFWGRASCQGRIPR